MSAAIAPIESRAAADPRIAAVLAPGCPEVFHSVATPTAMLCAAAGKLRRRLTQLREPTTDRQPGGVVENPDRALCRVERQAGEDVHPGGDALQVVGQFRDSAEKARLAVEAPGERGACRRG